MCGICGNFNLSKNHDIDIETLKGMVRALRHRGPEEAGIYKDGDIALGHARLSIVDLAGGLQPIHNEDRTVWIVYNGEVFNYPELRDSLEKKGHRFSTKTDTEVLVHLYEEKGAEMLGQLNGQFAFALWDRKARRLLLGRDRAGIRPLYYTVVDGSLLFASEIKSLLMDRRVRAAFDPRGLDQLFTFWSTLPPRTTFKDIFELPPAHCLTAENGLVRLHRYWDLCAQPREEGRSEDYYAEKLFDLLNDSIRIRLRADVPVAAYLSGGLDSSLVSSLVKKRYNDRLQTFSVRFADRDYDESFYQRRMADYLGTGHREVSCTYSSIGRVMPEVVWHAEKPLIRTAPAPMYLLSALVRDSGIKVVLTGEGADEMLGGYDLFKEMKIRRFWAKSPDSAFRPLLLKKLYGHISNWPRRAPAYLEAFYRAGLPGTETPHYSHIPRWETTGAIRLFYSPEMKEALKGYEPLEDFHRRLPADFAARDSLAQAQYIETATLLSGNLLSSQGDRMAMAHSVEGRYPFLDYRVMEFCYSLPARLKLKGLNEKYLLKKIARPYLPDEVSQREKQAYRAPDSQSFFNGEPLEYMEEVLSPGNIARSGCFDAVMVGNLVKKCRSGNGALIGNRHNMAITGIVTALLVDKLFMRGFNPGPLRDGDEIQRVE